MFYMFRKGKSPNVQSSASDSLKNSSSGLQPSSTKNLMTGSYMSAFIHDTICCFFGISLSQCLILFSRPPAVAYHLCQCDSGMFMRKICAVPVRPEKFSPVYNYAISAVHS